MAFIITILFKETNNSKIIYESERKIICHASRLTYIEKYILKNEDKLQTFVFKFYNFKLCNIELSSGV